LIGVFENGTVYFDKFFKINQIIFTNKEICDNFKVALKIFDFEENILIFKEVKTVVGYAELSKMNTFSMEDVYKLVRNKKTASSLILRLSKKGFVKKIRNNLYTCVNVATGSVYASRYHIACAINEIAYLSHHSAFEYAGIANQVYNDVYVSSKIKFADFEFEGITYRYVVSKFDGGIITPRNSTGIRVTSLERTVIDSIKDFEKIGGIEELLNCISVVPYLDEKQLMAILDAYDMQFLYQKAGFILEHYKSELQLSDGFIEYCKTKTGKSTRYLTKESDSYCKEWQLVVPAGLFDMTLQGGIPLV
jgi:predicted transcriptional regulator of viral defense system